MTVVFRLCGVLVALVGAFVIMVAVSARTPEGVPFPPLWIAGITVLGTLVVLYGVILTIVASDAD